MRHLVTPTRRALRRVLITLIVLVATVNAAAFLLTPLLDRYRDDLAALASERLGTPISVASLNARWRGFGPELVLHDLQIGEPGRGVLLTEASVDFGVWDMIRHLDLSPLRITLRDLQLHLVRRPDGRVELTGFEGAPVSGGGSTLPLAGRLRLENATLLWEDQRVGLPVQRFEHARLRLHLWPDRVTLSASLMLPEQGGRLHAGADLKLSPQDWSGEIYVAGRAASMGAIVTPYLPFPLQLTKGEADVELWSDWQASRLRHAEGRLALHDIELLRRDDPPLTLDQLATEFRYQRDGEDRELDLARLSLRREGHAWPLSDLHLSINLAGPGLPRLRLSTDYLDLGDVRALSRPWPLPGELAELRDQLQPSGILRDLRLTLAGGEGPPRWQLSTRFEQLSSRAWGEYPGVSGLAGSARGDQDHVDLQVATRDAGLDWPTLFRAPLPVDYLSGSLAWRSTPDGGHSLASQALIVDTPDIRSVSRLRLDVPADGPLNIDLHTELRDGDGRHTARYLPTRHMTPALVEWLDHAITSGRIPHGTLLLRGPLRDFPFDKTHTGRFSVEFDVRDLNLDYQPGWPPLRIDQAKVHFNDNSLDIALQRGGIYDSQVVTANARIDSLDPISALKVTGTVEGPLADPLRLLVDSPLRERFGDLAGTVRAKGRSRLDLDMAVALEDHHRDHLSGKLTLKGAQLALTRWPLSLTQAQGTLSFNLDGVSAQDISARLDGQPVRISVTPGPDAHHLLATTRIAAADLYQRLPGLPPALVSGATDLALDLAIPNHRTAQQVRELALKSDLKGLALHLPAPLGKDADTARDTRLTVPLDSGEPLHLRYGRRLDALIAMDGSRAALRFGGTPATLPGEPVLSLEGQLPTLALDPWLALAKQGGKGPALPPIHARLDLGRLQLGRLGIDKVTLTANQRPDGWHGSAEAQRFAGRFAVQEGQPVKVDLDRLDIDAQAGEEEEVSGNDQVSPADWPDLDLQVAALRINGADLGKLSLQARHKDGALRLEPLSLAGPLASFEGIAQWRGQGTRADSDLVGQLHTPKLGALLGALGYAPQFEGAATSADISLSWPGTLGAAELATLRGQITLSIGEGRLLELDPGVSRVFGLLNFAALQRRLRLDFSDIFRKGLAFDKISGSFRLLDGNAYTRDLTIKGPSGDIAISGRTGLVTRDLYQEVTLTPRFDATLPVASALAGGPITGIAVLLAQQVMKDKVDEFNRINYLVTGSWDDPKVERKSGGGLSRILAPVTELFDGGDKAPRQQPKSSPGKP